MGRISINCIEGLELSTSEVVDLIVEFVDRSDSLIWNESKVDYRCAVDDKPIWAFESDVMPLEIIVEVDGVSDDPLNEFRRYWGETSYIDNVTSKY